MRKSRLLLSSAIVAGFVLSVSASDIVGGVNNVQNNEQPVNPTPAQDKEGIISCLSPIGSEVYKERINFSDITDCSAKIENAKDKEIFITGKELRNEKGELRHFLDQNPDILVTLDVSSGDFVNENGVLSLSRDNLPNNIKHLKITGTENVTSIGGNFLYYCKSLKSIDLSPLSNCYFHRG